MKLATHERESQVTSLCHCDDIKNGRLLYYIEAFILLFLFGSDVQPIYQMQHGITWHDIGVLFHLALSR